MRAREPRNRNIGERREHSRSTIAVTHRLAQWCASRPGLLADGRQIRRLRFCGRIGADRCRAGNGRPRQSRVSRIPSTASAFAATRGRAAMAIASPTDFHRVVRWGFGTGEFFKRELRDFGDDIVDFGSNEAGVTRLTVVCRVHRVFKATASLAADSGNRDLSPLANAEDRDTRGFISITTICARQRGSRPISTFEPPVLRRSRAARRSSACA